MITIVRLTRGSVSARTGVNGNAQAGQNTAPLQSGNSGIAIVGQDRKDDGAAVSKLGASTVTDAGEGRRSNASYSGHAERTLNITAHRHQASISVSAEVES
jgi:hypothetical protein